jgi:hypothetical protein
VQVKLLTKSSAATKNCTRCLDSVHALELDAAKEARKVAFAAVGKEMEDNPDHPLVRTICCANMLQKRVNSLPAKYITPATGDDAGHLQEKLQAAYDSVKRAETCVQATTKALESLQAAAEAKLEAQSLRLEDYDELDGNQPLDSLAATEEQLEAGVDAALSSITPAHAQPSVVQYQSPGSKKGTPIANRCLDTVQMRRS